MTKPLADKLEVWGLEDDLLIFSDGSLGFGLKLSQKDGTCADDEHLNNFSSLVMQFLNGLPEGLSLQFVQDITYGHGKKLTHHKSLCAEEASSLAKDLVKERLDRLEDLDKAGVLPKHHLYLFVRRPMDEALIKKLKFLSKVKTFEPVAEEKFKKGVDALLHVRSDIEQGLQSLGVASSFLGQGEILDLMYDSWNPGRKVTRGRFDSSDVRSSLLFTDAVIEEQGFTLGAYHHRVISLKVLPEQTMASMASCLARLPFESRLLLSVRLPHQQKELEYLQLQRRLAFSMVHAKRSGVSDIESQAKLQDLETLLEEMIAQGERVFHVSLNIVLRSESKDILEEQVTQTLMSLRELGGSEGMVETLASFDIFSKSTIPNARCNERVKRLKTSNLADFLPLFGPWEGHVDTPSVLLRSRSGGLVCLDPFNPGLTNANQIVSGGSGAGKSFMSNILLLQMLKENPRIFIIDIGGSYQKLCSTLGGQYIPLGVGCDMALNPFDLLPGETEASNQKIKFLVGLVEVMTREEGASRLPKLERAEIEEAVTEVYKTCKDPKLSDLKARLLEHKELSIRQYGKILSPWCGNTLYGQFVDRDTSVKLHSPIVCFDLKGLEVYPDLQAVCLFLITDLVWRCVQQERERKKFLIFDEVWKILENDAGASFLADVYRTFRKYYASAIAISQNIDDFARSKVAAAIMPNSSIKWILMQKGADHRRLKEVLALNDAEVDLITSIRQERGVFSEAFLMAQDDKALVAIESTPLEYWIATTDPREVALINERTKLNPERSSVEILKILADEYPRGILAKRKEEKS